MKYCYKCKTEWKGSGQPKVRETCRNCDEYLHNCSNCSNYDKSVSDKCRAASDVKEIPNDKNAFNFCNFFVFADKDLTSLENKADSVRNKFDQLFN